ncbi:N-6 DNA methylase [Nocardiopsis sp. NPDC055879]
MPENRSPEQRAHTIADRVADAWHRRHGSGQGHIPLSVVAALALLEPPPNDRHRLADHVTTLPAPRVDALIRQIWIRVVNDRPDLTPALAPLLLVWHGPVPLTEQERRGSHEVARAAVGAGLYELTEDADQRHAVDLLGVVMAQLKGPKAQAARGAFYTPAGIAELLTQMTGPTEPGAVHDPTVGTGGLWRTVATAVRAQGQDPTRLTWVGSDLDPLAIACTAINSLLWGLGLRVLLTVGDVLTDEVVRSAYAQRREVLSHARQIRSDTRLKAAFRAVTHPTDPTGGNR